MNKLVCLLSMASMAVSLTILSGCKKGVDPDLSKYNIQQFAYAGSPLGVGRQENDTMK